MDIEKIRALPWRILLLLFCGGLYEHIIIGSLATYLPATLNYFGVAWPKVGLYVDISNGGGFVLQGITVLVTGYCANKYGTRIFYIV